ncbi:MAG: glycosyltransferase family 2 protein, partial [Acidobacteria bacterium]|nr:glycosyltransferase family 2 protein [Acidobacteriota bacterium]
MPRLSIIIVTYNSIGEIDACLASLARSLPPLDAETIVVDNASGDGTADAVRGRWPAVRVIDAGANTGFARATNLGIRRSSAPLLLFLNPDTEAASGAIERLVHALDSSPDAAVAGPRLLDERGRVELSFGRMIAPLAELRQKLLVRGHDRGLPVVSSYVERLTRRARAVDWVSGACLLARRSDTEAVGLFDERYFMYAEDVDFCAAIRARGRKVLFVPEAEVRHMRGRSAASRPLATEAAYRRSQLAFYEKHHPRWAPLVRAYLALRGRLPDRPSR